MEATAAKDRAAIGRANVAKRWANPENRAAVRIDDLTVDERRLVLALVDAAKSVPRPEAQDTEKLEGHGNVRPAA